MYDKIHIYNIKIMAIAHKYKNMCLYINFACWEVG